MNLPINQQNIIAILGIETLPNAQKVAIVDKIATLVEKRLLVSIYKNLDALRQKELTGLLEGEDAAALQEFLQHHVPDMAALLEEETNAVKQELGDWAEKIAET